VCDDPFEDTSSRTLRRISRFAVKTAEPADRKPLNLDFLTTATKL